MKTIPHDWNLDFPSLPRHRVETGRGRGIVGGFALSEIGVQLSIKVEHAYTASRTAGGVRYRWTKRKREEKRKEKREKEKEKKRNVPSGHQDFAFVFCFGSSWKRAIHLSLSPARTPNFQQRRHFFIPKSFTNESREESWRVGWIIGYEVTREFKSISFKLN